MKILIANTYHYNRGGDTTYAFSVAELLRNNGHEVHFISMKSPQNYQSSDEKYFVNYIDFVELNKHKNLYSAYKVISRSIYSWHSRKKIREAIHDIQPDIVHIQNIHAHITPSILHELKKAGIPSVWTLHDYKLICPNTTMLSNGKICEECKDSKFYMCAVKKCKKQSLSASIVTAAEAYVHLFLNLPRLVDYYISPSKFLRNKFIEFGWSSDRIVNIGNFLSDDKFLDYSNNDHKYIVFIGRFEKTKGLNTLLKAMLDNREIQLKILGDGYEREEYERFCAKNNLANVQFLGFKSRDDVSEILKYASFSVAPSEWYENYPYSVLESMAYGKPVIGSRIGGIPELIDHEVNGFLFEAGNSLELSRCIGTLYRDAQLRKSFSHNAFQKANTKFRKEEHYNNLMSIYEKAIINNNNN